MSLTSLRIGQAVERDGSRYVVAGNLLTLSDVKSVMDVADVQYDVKAVDGVWLLMFVEPTDASTLAVPDGEPAEKLHLTIGALDPKTCKGKRAVIEQVIEEVTGHLSPVKGKVGGIGQFLNGERVPVVALFDSPSLNAWRNTLLETLKSVGVTLLSDHGYTPHITLAYRDEAMESLPDVDDVDVTLPVLSLVWEGDRRDFQLTGYEQDVKGGPGSGHYSHVGRPGKRGGSIPNDARVPKDWFTTGPGSKIFADNVPEDFREQCIRVLTDPDVTIRYVQDLNRISIGDPPPEGGWQDETGRTQAYYQHSKGLVCFNPEFVEKGYETFRDSWYQKARRLSVRQVFAHEFGHHVFHEMYTDRPEGKTRTRKYDRFRDVWKGLFNRFVNDGLMEIRIKKDESGNEKKTYHAMSSTRFAEHLASIGLRRYSLSAAGEFIADVWMVNHVGTRKQKQILADYLNVDSLEELF